MNDMTYNSRFAPWNDQEDDQDELERSLEMDRDEAKDEFCEPDK